MKLLLFSFILTLILFIVLPIFISYKIYKWIEKRKLNKSYKLLAFIPIIIVVYLIFIAIYPSEDFYKEDFKEVTKMEFPKNGEILYKTASYPDHFGDYTSSFLVELDEKNIQDIKIHLLKNGFIQKENHFVSKELNYIESKIGTKKCKLEYCNEQDNGKFYFVGILDDNKSVIITRISW